MWFVLLGLMLGQGDVRQIRIPVTVKATPAEAWRLWTTKEGITSFFAPGCNIDLRVDGAYEIFFAPQAPPGQRGADSMRLLAVEPERRLVFTWNAPGTLPAIRAQRTVVEVTFERVGEDSTRVTLTHSGFGRGAEWDRAFSYFEKAWNGFVMPSFARRVAKGPIDWKASDLNLKPILASAAETLAVVRRSRP